MICVACGAENPEGAKFCLECGTPLASKCARCGTALPARARFCLECGTPVAEAGGRPAASPPVPAAPTPPAGASEPVAAERRLVSVLFLDLVGFTKQSENQDVEEVRDLLSRYFDSCRRIITLYGGTVEKYIGDAVVAFWGAVGAREDDAERAVRAALDLVQAVSSLGEESGRPQLQARAAVLTGEAAVTVGGVSEGMVHGDVVNTASRVQSLAPAGAVLVGDSTKRLSDAAVVYEDFGSHEVKGKDEPVQTWRALRVVAARGGAQRRAGLEPPFVGRDRELRLLKELFHAGLESRKAQLVSITGIAGIGKSRVAWEFFKYIDGVTEQVRWHAGRCLAYGEGVTYWALAEMVRTRIRLVEGEVGETALAKLRAAVAETVPDEEERRWIEPRLAQLVGLGEAVSSDRQDLFAAWRRFYERLSEDMPTVMVFEDMQWADPSLVEFIEYLLDWSRNYRLFVVTLGRAGESEKSAGRGHTSIHLEPLGRDVMETLITGLVPGLPEELRARILDQAQGVPLYAVETIRMLLDRGLLVPDGATYSPVGSIDSLDVPETLQTLIAARLDGLTPDERRLVQDAAVLGKTFTAAGLAFVTSRTGYDVQETLTTLVRKELLTVEASRTSPERGQYGFLQDLVRQVAYDTIGRNERRSLHLKVAEFLEQSFEQDQDEVIEVLASHYLEAYKANPEAGDANEIRTKARDMLVGAGQRAGSMGAAEEAHSYYRKAADLVDSPEERAELLEQAGQMSQRAGNMDQAREHFEEALAQLQGSGARHRAARVAARLGDVEWHLGRTDAALERMERAFGELQGEEADADVAALAAELGRSYALKGDVARAIERIDIALELAESLWLPEVLAESLLTKGVIATFGSRLEEALALTQRALALSLEYELPTTAVRAFNNIGDLNNRRDRCQEAAEQLELGVALARRVGERGFERRLQSELSWSLACMGRWDEALAPYDELPAELLPQFSPTYILSLPDPLLARGQLDEMRSLVSRYQRNENSADLQDRTGYETALAALKLEEGNSPEALALAIGVLDELFESGPASQQVKVAFALAMEAAIKLGDRRQADALIAKVGALPPGRFAPILRAHTARFRARLAAADGDVQQANSLFVAAAAQYKELGMPFWRAVALTEHAEWLADHRDAGEPEALLAEARAVFERLRADAWLARVGTGLAVAPTAAG